MRVGVWTTYLFEAEAVQDEILQELQARKKVRTRRAALSAPPHRFHFTHGDTATNRLDDELGVEEPITRIELDDVVGTACQEFWGRIHVAIRRPKEKPEHGEPNLSLHLAPWGFMANDADGLSYFPALRAHLPIYPHDIFRICLSVGMRPPNHLPPRFCKPCEYTAPVLLVLDEIDADDARAARLQFPDDRPSRVAGAVVDDNDLVVDPGGSQYLFHPCDDTFKMHRLIVCGNNNGKLRLHGFLRY